MKDILDSWEKQTKEWAAKLEAPGIYAPNCDRILLLISALRVQEEALKFYAERDHIKFNPNDGSINFDPSRTDWRIGSPYIDSVEYGQQAHQALANAERILKG